MSLRRAPPDVSLEFRRRIDAARPLSRAAVCVGAITAGAGAGVLLLDVWDIGPMLVVAGGVATVALLSLGIRRSRLCPSCDGRLGPEAGIFCPICGARISREDTGVTGQRETEARR